MPANMLDNAVCFALRISSLGNTRKVSTSQITTDADKTMIAVNKRLFDADEFRAIKKLDGEIRQFLYSRALPAFFLREGMHLMPNALIPEVETKLREYSAQRTALVTAFIAVYPDYIREAETRLRSLFNPADYMPAGEAERQFGLDWQYVNFGVPVSLRDISPELFEEEKSKAEKRWAEATESVQQVMRASMAELVEHMIERLSGNSDGKPKIFRDSLVNNMQDFLSTFDARNITSDEQLAAIASKAKDLLNGVSPEYLRNSENLRTKVIDGFAEVKKELDAMMVDRPTRAITFED